MAFIPIKDAGAIGIIRDAFAHELPINAWNAGNNVRFSDGYIERIKGHSSIYGTPSVEPYFILPYSSGSGRQWIYAGAAKAYSVSVATHTNITRQTAGVDVDYSATADNVWSGGVLSGIAILNNGTDVPQQYAGSGKAADLSNWPSTVRCKSLRPFENYLVAMNLTISGSSKPHRVRVSHPADPGSVPVSWDETDQTKDVVEFDLAATQDRLIDGATMGDSFWLYKESSIYRMTPNGSSSIFTVSDPISRTAGALALNCIAPFPGGHLVLGQGDIFINNGGGIESVITSRMKRWLKSTIDPTYYTRSFVVAHPYNNEIWIGLVQNGATVPNVAMIWSWSDNTWTFRDLPNAHYAAAGVIDALAADTIDDMAGTIDTDTDLMDFTDFSEASQRLILASTNTKLYLTDTTTQFDGTDFTAFVERTGLDFDAPEMVKMVLSIRPIFEGGVGDTVSIYVGGSDDAETDPAYGDPVTFTIGTDRQADVMSLGYRFLALKIESSASATWRLKSYTAEVETLGEY
ncbi:hypothetical protein [Herbaspirillum sp. ST 5-3]|uniref:hypothetical protein n=1 Tax=Oxalobacteraceae TaxID=75682 RepID=UPI0010A2AA0C|nr:hypothetical protein [Herbaspirillum sp. ST 5-3]